MKIKLSQIVNAADSLKELQTIKLPAKVSYKIMRLVDKLSPIYETFNKKRDELVTSIGEKNEDGNFVVTGEEKIKDFSEKVNELLAIDEDVDFQPISVSELGEVEVEAKNLVSFIFTD